MSRITRRADGQGSSFLPEDYLRRKVETRSVIISVFLFCVVTLGVIGAFFVTNRQWNTVRALQEDINKQYATETKKIEQLKILELQKTEMLEKAEVTTALIEKVPRSILLAELINRMPKDLTLTELNLKSKKISEPINKKTKDAAKEAAAAAGKAKQRSLAARPGAAPDAKEPPPKPVHTKYDFTIEMIGLAGSDEEIADYHMALVQCPLLYRVEMLQAGDVKVDDVQMRKFRIEAQIRNNADARQIEPLHIPRLPPRPGLASPLHPDPNAEESLDPTRPRPDDPTADAGKKE